MTNKKPNISGLLKSAEEKRKKTIEKVEKTIKEMVKRQQRINFQTVAEHSGVSKTYLYQNMDLKDRIASLRNQQDGISNPKQTKRNMTDNSKDIIIESLRLKVRKLEKERDELKNQLRVCLGKLYDDV